MGTFGAFSDPEGASATPAKTPPLYPSRQGPAKAIDYPLGRQLLVIKAIHARLIDPCIPFELRDALPSFMSAVAEDTDLSVADMLQAQVAVGLLCALHLAEYQGDDIHGRTCIGCEFGFAPSRYRGHAPIPYSATGERLCAWCPQPIGPLAAEGDFCSVACVDAAREAIQ